MAVGCSPAVHTITQFHRYDPDDYEIGCYNINSRNCKVEPIWNVTAEAGKKTCVFHWLGSAWPPTSDSPNLMVVDGTAPGAVGMAILQSDTEFFFGANEKLEKVRCLPATASTATAVCVVDDMDIPDHEAFDMGTAVGGAGSVSRDIGLDGNDGQGVWTGGPAFTYDAVQSYIRPAEGWANAPEGAKEFVMLTNKGLVRRHGLVLQNEEGKYDHVAIYKSKNDVDPLCVCYVGKIIGGVIDTTFKKM